MSERISTKAGIFESGVKDAQGVQYKDGRLIACRNNKLEDYTVADGTEVICDRAFMNMKGLRSVTLPDSLKAIGESAFSGCKALADIDIPEGVTEIRQATFRDCDSLAAIELPASVTEIEKFAFGRGLTTLVVNASEMKIDRYAFMNARDLSTLMVPAGSADYYRSLLADMRVKAEVEEMEEKTEEPASLLDAFMADPEKVTEETTNIYLKPNNMETEKKMKKITIILYDKTDGGYRLRFVYDLSDDYGKEYAGIAKPEDLSDLVYKVQDSGSASTPVTKDFNNSIDLSDIDYSADQDDYHCDLETNNVTTKLSKEGKVVEKIEFQFLKNADFCVDVTIPENETFNPAEAYVVFHKWIFPNQEMRQFVSGIIYCGKYFPIYLNDWDSNNRIDLWIKDNQTPSGWRKDEPNKTYNCDDNDCWNDDDECRSDGNKIVEVEIQGLEIRIVGKENGVIKNSIGRFVPNKDFKLIVDGKEYPIDTIGTQEDFEEDEDIEWPCELEYNVYDAASYDELAVKSYISMGTIKVEIPSNEEFDPKNFYFTEARFYHPDDTKDDIITTLVYKGVRQYNCIPEEVISFVSSREMKCS